MAHHATVLLGGVRNYRMLAIGLKLDVGETRFFEANVTRSATIRDPNIRMPNLLNARLKVALQRDRFATGADHPQVAFLVMPPFAEVILCGRNREQYEQNRAHDTKRAQGITE
jgi:hypothetical protein